MALADSAHVVDTRDATEAISVARREKVDGAMTLCTDLPVRTVAAVNEALGLPGLLPEVAKRATHKGLMRDAFASAGAPIPRFVRARSLEEVRSAAEEIGFPVILKPPSSSGSRGIFKANRNEEIPRGYAHALSIAGTGSEILVEEFIDGPEVSVEVISFSGNHEIIAITDKRTTGDPYWVELGHVQPSRLPNEAQEDIRQATKRGLDALGISDSPSHVEIKVGRDGVRLMEIGARLGGDFITTELTRRSTGVNMVQAAINLALGREPDITKTTHLGASICYIIPTPGRVERIEGLDRAREMSGVKVFQLDLAVGMRVKEVMSSLDRPGYVICEGKDAAEAEERALAAAKSVNIVTTGR
jgi:biotin carboxylase